MLRISGTSILERTAVGRLRYYGKQDLEIRADSIADTAAETARLARALAEAGGQLQELHDKTAAESGEENAAIFELHQMLLEDDDYLDAIRGLIAEEKRSAEYAVHTVGERFAKTFAAMADPYMKAREADIRDVSDRVAAILSGAERRAFRLGGEPCILMAEDLAPSETVQLEKSKLLGFVTRGGSVNSHTAILARTMNIPALVGVAIDPSWDGLPAVIDGAGQTLIVDPDPDVLARYRAKHEAERKELALLQELKGLPNRTLNGHSIEICANIGQGSEAQDALRNDAQGIGLFRSEFIYLGRDAAPTEEEQFEVYRRVAEEMQGRRVIIRTLDIGADKQAGYLGLKKEENPALGYRAIRICLTRPELFKAQLRAILRAAAFGRVAVMFPMVTSVREVREAKALLEECRRELAAKGTAFGELETGIMIETPAAVMIADDLAREVQFFSIGTNDLTQYTLAIDRQNPELGRFYAPDHPAILRMIRMTAESAHRNGCWVGICGELGANGALTETFLRMGIDELSVAPSAILPLRKRIRGMTLSER